MKKYDLNCGHAPEFRAWDRQGGDTVELCLFCEMTRRRAEVRELQDRVAEYGALHPLMDIASKPGTKIVFWYPHNGWPVDGQFIKGLGIKLGDILTVDHTVIHSSGTELYLKEFPGKCFNSANFGSA